MTELRLTTFLEATVKHAPGCDDLTEAESMLAIPVSDVCHLVTRGPDDLWYPNCGAPPRPREAVHHPAEFRTGTCTACARARCPECVAHLRAVDRVRRMDPNRGQQ